MPGAPASLALRRLALCALFFLPGISISSWVTRTPAIRDLLGASTAQMGLVLFGLSIGSMLGILTSGPAVMRLGARRVVLVASALLVLAMPTIAAGAATQQALVVTLGLALFGAGTGGGEVAMNIEGAEVERESGRTFLPTLHGCFSLGTVVGAGAGILANAVHLPVVPHLLAIGVIGAVLLAWAIRLLPAATGQVTAEERAARGHRTGPPVWKDGRLLLIGAIVLAMALAEGTANDWLPLVMVDGHGFDAALGSAVYAVFAASMTAGRFAGGPIIDRLGRAPVLAASAACATAGLVLVSLVDNQIVAGAAVILWGLGASLGFPVALSAAGDSGPQPAQRVALASIVGYMAFLVGPPVLGFVGEHLGLRGALLLPAAVVAVAIFLAPSTGNRALRRSS
ncbi:MFS transporter [Brachybacterium kimchii]|uniref:MFS transporter n=1 Tax=Brachybacterium kimchii TaxID=2942909 RepID=A0ABY4N4T4_9MICO|nr:MFS transporter [Brachybacterium kimchii]UQN29154.1 MFS transporter [Brachybacterium kimchii]